MPKSQSAVRPEAAQDREVVLIFPAGLPRARRYREQAAAEGQALIGASSLAFDPAAGDYDDWARLPYVHEPEFGDVLAELIRTRGVTAIFTPHGVVSGVLTDLLPTIAPAVRMIDSSPIAAEAAAYREALDRAEIAAARPWFCLEGGGQPLSALERAGLVRLVDAIPGMTDLDKIDAVIEVMRHVPPGDVVEIGSWWGRSAALFLLLARRYGVGPVLCVDAWRSDCLDQGVPALDRASARLDMDQALTIFQINLSPLAQGDLNYIRAPSSQAAPLYGSGLEIATAAFGKTRYQGRIALLHIDGNHTYEQAALDARLWTPHVRPGGWIVFDDYRWAFGDGPKRVGDAFLVEHAGRIDVSLVIGTALFVRLADA